MKNKRKTNIRKYFNRLTDIELLAILETYFYAGENCVSCPLNKEECSTSLECISSIENWAFRDKKINKKGV